MHLISFLLFVVLLFLPAQSLYYVKQDNKMTSPDGTLENPFNSLNQAVQTLGVGSFELVLLGNEFILTSALTIPSDSQYVIRADSSLPQGTYFPLKLGKGASISVPEADLTLQDIQIVETVEDRSLDYKFLTMDSGYLTLKRVLVADISYIDNYSFLESSASVADAYVSIEECVFRNLTNIMITLSSTQFSMSDSSISGILQTAGFFISVLDFDKLAPNSNISIKNITVEDVVLYNSGALDQTTLFGFFMSTANIQVEDISVQNIVLDVGTYFFQVVCGEEDMSSPTSFTFSNLHLTKISEEATELATETDGLIFDLTGASSLVVTDVFASDIQLKHGSLFSYTPNLPKTKGKNLVRSTAKLDRIEIKDSTNTKIIFKNVDKVSVENVNLEKTRCDAVGESPLFSFTTVSNTIVRNFQSKTHYGPMFRLNQSPIQLFENCNFEDTTTSHTLPVSLQNFLSISRKTSDPQTVTQDRMITTLKQITMNGYVDTDGLEVTGYSNDTYVFNINSEVGEVIIQDLKLTNVLMGGFLSQTMASIKINGLTVDADISLDQTKVPWHTMFQFVNLGQLEMRNADFRNNKNADLFNLYNINRGQLYDTATPDLVFENITVINNDIISAGANDRFPSLFVINSPLKLARISISNSNFVSNKINGGLISTRESRQVDISLLDNIFKDNFAQDSGTILKAQDMQDDYSNIELTRNTFTNNSCLQNGAVFALISAKLKVNSNNNTYIKNSAGGKGGVGYVLKVKAFHSELNGLYSNNKAGISGGSWYFDVSCFERSSIVPLEFTSTTFEQSTANQSGGAFYIATGNLGLKDCKFTDNKAGSFGGDFYLKAFASLHINDTTFTRSSAQVGSFLYAETLLNQTVLIESSQISDISAGAANSVLVKANAGSFKLLNTKISNVSGSLFDLDGSTIDLNGALLQDINCKDVNSFCILRGALLSFTFSDSDIRDIESSSDLIVLNSPVADVVVTNVSVLNVKQSSKSLTSNDAQLLFVLKANNAKKVIIKNSLFADFVGFGSVQAKRSLLVISNSKFARGSLEQNKKLSLEGMNFSSPRKDFSFDENVFFGRNMEAPSKEIRLILQN